MQSKSMQQKDTSSGQPSPFHTADKMDEKRRADKLAQEKEHEIKLHKLLSECIVSRRMQVCCYLFIYLFLKIFYRN